MSVLTIVFVGLFRCTAWPESKSPVIKDLSLLLGRPKVAPSELAKRTEKQGEKRNSYFLIVLGPVVQRLDNAIHRINRYPADKC